MKSPLLILESALFFVLVRYFSIPNSGKIEFKGGVTRILTLNAMVLLFLMAGFSVELI